MTKNFKHVAYKLSVLNTSVLGLIALSYNQCYKQETAFPLASALSFPAETVLRLHPLEFQLAI